MKVSVISCFFCTVRGRQTKKKNVWLKKRNVVFSVTLSLCLENIHSQGVRASVCIPFVLGTFLRYPSYTHTHTKTKRVNSGILNHSTQGLRECVCVCVGQWRQPWLCRKEWGQSWKFEWVQERKEGRVGFLKCHFFLSVSLALTRVCRRFVALRYRHYADGSSFSRVLRRFNWEQAISLVTR